MDILARAVAQLDALKAVAVENDELFAHYVLTEAQRTIIEVLAHPNSVTNPVRQRHAKLRVVLQSDIIAMHGTHFCDLSATDPLPP